MKRRVVDHGWSPAEALCGLSTRHHSSPRLLGTRTRTGFVSLRKHVADYFSRLFRGRVRVLPFHRLSDPPSSSVLAHPRSPCGRILILGGNLDGSWRPRSPWWGRENGLIRNRPPVLVRACATPRSAALGHPPWRRCDWSGRWHMAQPVTSPRNVGPRGA